MTEFERRLQALTPAAVDRDALLFAAGRASAPSPKWWRRACGLLVLTQTATLALWLDRPAPPAAGPPPPTAPAAPPPPPLDPSSYLALRQTWDVPPAAPPAAGPDGPPLTAGSRSF